VGRATSGRSPAARGCALAEMDGPTGLTAKLPPPIMVHMSGDTHELGLPYAASGRCNRNLLRAAATTTLVFLGALLAPMGTASAQGVIYPASACLNGDAGPRELVASSNGPSFFSNVSLYCGDPTKGVIHIDSEHPISEDGSDDANVAQCHSNIMYYGDEVPAAEGNRAWQIARPSGGTATLVFDATSLETITMFTSDSNNWAACAAYPD
jgi:hypothetical protein